MMTHRLYDVLGVPRDASDKDVRRAYHKLAMEHHPDKGGDADRFKEISQAYEVLGDAQKREAYDRTGDESGDDLADMFARGFNPFEMFSDPFARRPRPVIMRMTVSLKDAYYGAKRTLSFERSEPCASCTSKCSVCGGRGKVSVQQPGFPFGIMVAQKTCMACTGNGSIVTAQLCVSCDGRRKKTTAQAIDIHIPAGVSTGNQMVLEEGSDAAPARIIQFVVDEGPFRVRGADLVFPFSLTLAESIVGKVLTVPHPREPIRVDLANFGVIRHGHAYELRGQGMPVPGSGRTGNLVLVPDIKYPELKAGWTEEQKAVWAEAFRKLGI